MQSVNIQRVFMVLAASASLAVLSACQQQAEEPKALKLETQEQRISYGIGVRLANNMKNDGLNVDPTAFAAGLQDALDGNEPKLTEEEFNTEMMAFQQKVQEQQQAEAQAAAQANLEAGQAFLEENKAREGVQVTDSGLQYEVLTAGTGASPTPEDAVEVHYKGTLIDGTVFDSSYDRGQPVTFGVTQVIPGWTEALQLMQEGAKYKLYIPSDLAYGANGAGQVIGPNSTLVFEVELLSIVKSEDDSASSEE
jgi:FKBP-type peptidyl-prolyl cis-trans isomerase